MTVVLAGLLLIVVGGMPAVPSARAQTASGSSASTPADAGRSQPLVTEVRFQGGAPFEREELVPMVRTAPNRRILGIPGLTWWRWLYRLGETTGGGVGEALQRVGEAPAFLDRRLLSADAERLRAFYRQEGFRDAQVETAVVTRDGRGEATVTFQIDPGRALHTRRVRYVGLGGLSEAARHDLVAGSLLRPGQEGNRVPNASAEGTARRADEGDALSFPAGGRRYSEARFLRERGRILDALRDGGYARVTRDSVQAIVAPAPPDSFDLTFRVRPGPRYRVGDLHVRVEGPEGRATLRTDTLRLDGGGPGRVTVRMEGESKLSTRLLERALRLRPGRWYSRSDLLATKRRLEGTGVFAFTDISALEPRLSDSSSVPLLPHRITLRTRPRHSVRLESFALQRTGFVSEEVGFGLGATYENANLFSDGETFRARVAGSFASDFETDDGPRDLLFSSAQLEGSASITFPYLIAPFEGLERLYGGLYDARTQVSVNLLTARRENLGFVIRGRGGARLRLEMRHAPALVSLVDVLDLSISNPDTLGGFQGAFLNRVIGRPDDPIVRDPVQRARIIEDYTAPQINSALRYTLRAATVNPLVRAEGYSYEAAAETGGFLPALLDRFALTPDTVESSLPGLPFLRGSGTANRLRYRPYVWFIGDARRYEPVGPGVVLAGKLIAGWAHPVGQPGVVPFERRFYAGGGSSVRGWALRELRPAAPGDSLTGDVPNLLGGDVKLEASVEVRQTVFEDLLGRTDWIGALFLDAGNAWTGPRNPGPDALRFRFGDFYRQIGVGGGLGLRLDWDFLVLRLDAAFKVHDPVQTGNPLPDGFGSPRLHFGIGHAF